MRNIITQQIANFFRIDHRQVNLVRDAVKSKFDGLLSDRTIEVIDELDRDLLCHVGTPSSR